MKQLLILILSLLAVLSQAQMPEDFVYLSLVDDTIIQNMRYHTYHNFVGKPIIGYNAGECILTKEAAAAVSQVQKELLQQNKTLKVYDCYRPQKAVTYFNLWAEDPEATQMKEEFYPTLQKDEIIPEYVAVKSGHSRGSTIDLTIVDLPPKQEPTYIPGQKLYPCTNPPEFRFPDNSINFGTGFDCFNHKAHTASEEVDEVVHQRRMEFVDLMEKYGFTNYVNEWWHFTLKNEPFPDTYFDFDIEPINNNLVKSE